MELSDQFPFQQTYEWEHRLILGEGSFGKVFKVKNKNDNEFYAIKQMKMDDFNKDPTLMQALQGEIHITTEVNSQFTVKMIDYKIGHKYTYIVLELCDTDLRKQLSTRKFTEEECIKAFEEIMQGFRVLVQHGYIHRDVKPANTLIKNHHYKVADFGFACKADIFGRKKLTDICGTPIYMAPQLLRNQPYTAKSDIWSLALMLYEMIFGYVPWPCRSMEQYINGICTKPLTFPYDAKIGENTKDFLKKTLVMNEQKRMSWKDLFEHPLIKQNEVGNNVEEVKINSYVRDIMVKLQARISKYNIDWVAILNKRHKEQVNVELLTLIVRDIDPTITTYQIKALFDFIDKSKVGSISWETLQDAIVKIDYRNQNDVISRKVDEIIAILKEKKADPKALFEQIDINHTGTLDFSEFCKFIASFAPCYIKTEVLQIFRLFDNDKNGIISKQQFLEFLTKRLPSDKPHVIEKDRALRNLQQLTGYLKWSKIDAMEVMKIADTDHNSTVDIKQFTELLVKKFNFHISTTEIEEIFALINKDQGKTIELSQLLLALK